jgi:hypothetical protein
MAEESGQRDRERHHDVGGARTARGERRDRLMTDTEIGVRHVGRDLLVARRDQLDLVAGAIERVEHADIAVAANAEHVGNLVPDQMLGDQVGALHPWHGLIPRVALIVGRTQAAWQTSGPPPSGSAVPAM